MPKHFSHNYSFETHGESALRDLDLCKMVMLELEKRYPGHPWLVAADSAKSVGTLSIQLGYGNHLGRMSKAGFLIHLTDLGSQTSMKTIMRYGGELLERYRLKAMGHRIEDRLVALDGPDLTGIGRG